MLIFCLQPWSKQTIPFVLHNFHKEFGILHFNVKMYQDNQAVADISISICYHSERRCDTESRSMLSPAAQTKSNTAEPQGPFLRSRTAWPLLNSVGKMSLGCGRVHKLNHVGKLKKKKERKKNNKKKGKLLR